MPSCTSQWLISHYNHNVHKMFIKKITICILLEQSHANGMISCLEKFLFFFFFSFFFFEGEKSSMLNKNDKSNSNNIIGL